MTRNEAIYRLRALCTMCDFKDAYGEHVDSEPYDTAIDMAVEALEHTGIVLDGTLVIDTDQYSEVKRVLVQHGTDGTLYYADEPQWIPCSQPPETDENVFIARGNENFMSCCIGHYDLDAETWYEDRNWFAKILYDALYWCKMPTLPEPWRGEEP